MDNIPNKGDESDDEPITSIKKKKNRAILDDSDEESRESFQNADENLTKNSLASQEQTVTKGVLGAYNETVELKSSVKFEQMKSNDYDSDKENVNPQKLSSQRTERFIGSNNGSEEEDEDEPIMSTSHGNTKEANTDDNSEKSQPLGENKTKYSDLFDAEESEDESGTENAALSMSSTQENSKDDSLGSKKSDSSRIIKPDKLLSELFDAEESDDEEGKSSDVEEEGKEDVGYESDEEMPREMSAALKRRLAKGAAKKQGKTPNKSHKSKAPRVDKEELQQLHSETQRMVREKAAHIPYHQPKKLGLDVFLARTKQKQEALQTIKGPRQVGWKKAPELTAFSKKDRDAKSETIDLAKKSSVKHKLDEIIENKNITKSTACAESANEDSSDIPDLAQRLKAKQSESVSEKSFSPAEKLLKLPSVLKHDTATTQVESFECDAARTDMESVPVNENVDHSEQDKKTDEAKESMESECCIELEPLSEDMVSISLLEKKDTSESEVIARQTSQKQPELDSGYLTTPAHSSSEDSNSSSHKEKTAETGTDNKIEVMDTSDNAERTNGNDSENAMDAQVKANAALADNVTKAHSQSDIKKPEGCNTSSKVSEISTDVVETPNLSKAEAKRKLIEPKLEALGLNQVAPRLSGGPDAFIDLDDDKETEQKPKADPGVMKLIERFMKHSAKRPKAKSKDVEISSVSKQREGDKEELKLEKISYHVDSEEEDTDKEAVPGAKLLKLKSKLQEQMAKDREKARQLRSQAEQYENEEGFEEEEEEAEMTDSEESEEEELIDEEEEEEELDEEEYGVDEQEKEANPFVDKEAAEEDEEEYGEEALHLELDSNDIQEEEMREEKRKGFLAKAFSKTKSLPMFDDDDDDNKKAESVSPGATNKAGENHKKINERPFGQLSQGIKRADQNEDQEDGVDKDLSVDSSFEMMSSMLPAAQRSSKKPQPSPSSLTSAASSNFKAKSAPFLPIENTQDLFNFNTSPTQVTHTTHADAQNESFNFHLEESQSCMLDDEGFLKVNTAKKSSRRQLVMPQQSSTQSIKEALGLCSGNFDTGKGKESDVPAGFFSTQSGDNMDDLMSLCSGKFSTAQTDSKSNSNQLSGGSTGFDVDASNGEGMSQLLGLCSGRFTAGQTQLGVTQSKLDQNNSKHHENISNTQKKNRKAVIEEDEESESEVSEDENEEEDNFIVDSSVESEIEEVEEKDEFSEDEEQEQEDEEEAKKFTSFFEKGTKKKKIRRDFVDEEAELSGSEAESDENDDLGDEFDVMEEEEGDFDVNMTEEALRAQVGRVHQKTVQDEDDREIRLMQEYYLQDGDLHSEGGGRKRRFRWAGNDEDMIGGGMDGSDNEDHAEDPIEEKWRLERFERERFLQEQKQQGENNEKENPDDEEGTLKFGNFTYKQKKNSSFTSLKMSKSTSSFEQEAEKSKEPLKKNISDINTPQNLFKAPKLRASGSFLSRSKDTLTKIANLAKPVGNVSGPRNSRSLLFSTMSQEEKEQQEPNADIKKPQMKRSISTPSQPAAKKQKLERTNTLPANSIFKLLH